MPKTRRSTFFSFHYQRDIWRVNVVRNQGAVDATAAAGWKDASLWEATKLKGNSAIKSTIDRALVGTDVTVVLIGKQTAKREWVNYEIRKSIERGNGLIGVHVHNIRNQDGAQDWFRGPTPKALLDEEAPVVTYKRDSFAAQVERAAVRAGKRCLPHGKDNCFACRYIDWWWQ